MTAPADAKDKELDMTALPEGEMVPIQQTVTLDRIPGALARNTAGGARGKTAVRI